MSKYSQVRSYIVQQVQAVDSNYTEWTKTFSANDIPATLMDSRFHIQFSNISSETNNDNYFDNVPVTLRIYKKLGDNFSSAIDEMLDKAYDIRNALLDHQTMHTTDNIRYCNVSDLQIDDLGGTNKNVIEVRLNITMTLIFPF